MHCHALQTCVGEGTVRAIVELVLRLPNVDADGLAVADLLGGSNDHQAAATADVDNALAP